jgi:hypothetical protein
MQFARRLRRAGCLFVEYHIHFNFLTKNYFKLPIKMPENELRSTVFNLRALLSI